jgi:hypothetical protein
VRRSLALLAGVALLAAVVPSPASAHTTGIHTGFVATVSGVTPALPGLLVRVIGGHERLSVQNWTERTIVIFGENGEVVARLAPGKGKAWADPRIEGEADGKPFAIGGFLGYRPPPAAEAHGSSGSGWPRWATVAALAGGAVLVLAALALPLVRRKGEGEREESATGS